MKQKIIRDVIVLFSKYGYDSVTVKEVAFETGISEKEIKELYPQKEDVLKDIFEYIEEELEHYEPQEEDVRFLTQKESAESILRRFVTSYDLTQDFMRQHIYRLIFREQYRSGEISEFGYKKVLMPPRINATKTLDVLMEMGLIPQADSRIIADMWNRTSLICEMLATLHDGLISYEEYLQLTEFFIQIAMRGVKIIPTEHLVVDWKKRDGQHLEPSEMTKKQRIMHTALDLFEQYGYHGVSMTQIAEAAGISAVTIFSKYPSKSSIMKDIVATLTTTHKSYEESPVFEAIWAGEAKEQIVLKLANAFSPIIREDVRRLYKILFREQYNNEDAGEFLVSTIFNTENRVCEVLERMAGEGKIKPCDSRIIARVFAFSMCAFTVTSTFHCVDPEENERVRMKVVALLVSIVLNGFRDGQDG